MCSCFLPQEKKKLSCCETAHVGQMILHFTKRQAKEKKKKKPSKKTEHKALHFMPGILQAVAKMYTIVKSCLFSLHDTLHFFCETSWLNERDAECSVLTGYLLGPQAHRLPLAGLHTYKGSVLFLPKLAYARCAC